MISAAGDTPILELEGLTLAPELLAKVERRLLPERAIQQAAMSSDGFDYGRLSLAY